VDKSIVTDRNKCKACGVCPEKCPANAREIIGKSFSVTELMQEVEKDIPFYEESGGGVTVSGGEPLTQPAFLHAFLSTCKEKGIHTALDTSGYAEKEILMKISKNVDLFLYDLKVMDDRKHRRYTGVSNKKILRNLELLDSLGKKIIVRFPLIPHINSNKDNIHNMCEFISDLRNVKEIDVLPYHKLGVEKASRLGKEAKIFEKPSDEMLDHSLRMMKSFGLKVKIGG
jgi:pyruvate formate lyase activating enzyme